jgi:protein-S-isoprenylcysteine O-methyltransferase Ste14
MDNKMFARYAVRETLGLAVMGVALFWPAGKLAWWPTWAVLGVMAVWIAATAAVILRTNPALLAERLGPRKGAKRWDVAILSALGILQLVRYVVAGFDQRFNWTSGIPLIAQLIALGLCALGYALVVWATASNAFFSQVVRLQPERGQTVATGGPYRFARHPAYLGAVIYELAAPVVLASWWCLAVSLVNVGLLFVRTALEDRALQVELPGYADFTRRVRWRLLPGIW